MDDSAFIVALNPQGTDFIFSTVLRGCTCSTAGIAVDASGNSYITGWAGERFQYTYSPIYKYAGNGDAIVMKLNAGGIPVYSTFLGGSAFDNGTGIAVDSSGNAYIAGTTKSTNFPTVNSFQSTLAGRSNAFVAKIDSSGSALIYSTYLGGINTDSGYGITVNSAGNAYVTGETTSPDFPQIRSLQSFTGDDAFITELAANGSSLVYSTLLGGSDSYGQTNYGIAIASDSGSNVYVTGFTNSRSFPTTSNPTNFTCCSANSNFANQYSFIAKLADDTTPPPPPTWTRVEQDNSAVQYTGDWLTNTNPGHSGGSAVLTLVNSVTFSFSGTGVRWIGYSDPWSGIANVYIDGVFQTSVDTYSSMTRYQVVQYTKTGLASGPHTLKIQATGQHNSAASSSWVWVDAFEWTSSGGTGGSPDFSVAVTPSAATVVQGGNTTYTATITGVNGFSGTVSLSASGFGSGASGSFSPASLTGSGSSTLTVTATGTAQTGAFPLTITGSSGGLSHSATVTLNVNSSGGGGGTTWTRVEQDNAAVHYTGDWLTNTDPGHSGGSAKLTLVNSVTFSFSGTGARWIGFSDPWSGIANVYVDGVFQASVDTYSSMSKYQVVQYTTTGLASGNHTLKIQATGQHGSAASSSWVWVDAFEWTSSGGTGGSPDFTIAVTPTTATVSQGGTTTYTATVTAVNGFGGAVSLSASGFGSGADGSFNPATITGSGSSTLTVTATGTAQTGAFSLTITGSSGGLSHSATATLNVNPSGGGTTWTRVEQNNAAVQYTGDWLTNTDPGHSGGSAALTLVNSVTFSFSGSGVRWIGFSDQWSGIANVYVDGVFQGSIDTYSGLSRYQVVQFTITGLASGNHTLKIQATGQHSSAASSSWVWVDAFEYAN
jgi:hypothetical protein